MSKINVGWEKTIGDLSIEHIITPFIQNDELAEIEKMEKATGGKAILSRKTAVAKARLVDDPDAEIARIEEEERADAENNRMMNVFEGGV